VDEFNAPASTSPAAKRELLGPHAVPAGVQPF
jgi:hypothetical protein